MRNIGLISDTHSWLEESVFDYFKNCDEIWHAGDIGNIEVADRLSNFKSFRAVYGNIDGQEVRKQFPLELRFFCEEVDVYITHIGGYPNRYSPMVKEVMKVKSPQLFICGHSHILKVQFDKKYKCLHMNPGAAGKYGFHKTKTLLRFSIDKKEIKNLEVVELGPRVKKLS